MTAAAAGHPYPLLIALVVAGAALAIHLPAAAQVHAPKIVSEHTPDLHSLTDLVAGVVKPGMGQKDKAHALWRIMVDGLYHWSNPVEFPARGEGQFSDVTDPIKLLNVYGYTLCFCSAGPMESIWRAGGLDAREFGLPGHVAPEVWYEGAYHYLDNEMKGYYRNRDGAIASIRECGLRPAELMVKPTFPKGFFPLSERPFRTYLSRMVYAGIADEGPSWYGSHRARGGHLMNVSLRKGETYYRSWDNVGRFICDYKKWLAPGAFGVFDVRRGPADTVSERTFGNGVLIYEPDLTSATDEYAAGVHSAENIVQTGQGLTCGKGAASASAVFRFELPYVIAGDPHKLEEPDTTTDAAVLTTAGRGTVSVAVSVDNGRSWRDAGVKGFGRTDLSRFVERRYGYQLKLILAPGAVLKSFRAETSFQLAPASLPGLRAGANRMTFTLGAEPWEMMTWTPPTWTTEKAFRAATYRTRNIRWSPSWPIAVSTADTKKPGHVIYELAAPAGKRLRKVSIDLGGSLRWKQWHEDKVHLSVAEGQPEGFRRLGTVRGAPASSHWNRHLYREVDLPSERNVRTLYVRFDIFRKVRAAVSQCRFRMFFEDDKPAPVGAAGLVITHGWLEDGKVRTFQTRSPSPGSTYTVRTGPKFQRPVFLCMEVPGKAGLRAGTDPLGLAGYKRRPASYYPPEAAGFSNEQVLRKLDREGLAQADTMVEVLLNSKNQPVVSNVAKMLGYRPVEAVRPFLERMRKQQPKEPRWRRGLARLDEWKAPSRRAFLDAYLPALTDDAYGLGYVRKIGETGTAEDVAPLLAAIPKSGKLYLKLALAQAATALGSEAAADVAARLVGKTQSAAHQVPVDAVLLRRPAHSRAARERLSKRLQTHSVADRWQLVTLVGRSSRPGDPVDGETLLAEALADANPWIRLAALSALWKRDAGDALVRAAAAKETETHLKDAYQEFLARKRRD